MSYAGDDDEDDDFLFLVMLAGAAYVAFRFWQRGYTYDSLAQSVENFAAPFSAPGADGGGFDGPAVFSPMQLSPDGAAFIKGQEGFSSRRYRDGDGYSIGYGHFIRPGESFVEPISNAEAESLFAADAGAVVAALNAAIRVPVSQGQFDAITDLGYQEGIGAVTGSTLLTKLNAGDYDGAASEFSRWVYAGGQVNQDIVSRRQADQARFYS